RSWAAPEAARLGLSRRQRGAPETSGRSALVRDRNGRGLRPSLRVSQHAAQGAAAATVDRDMMRDASNGLLAFSPVTENVGCNCDFEVADVSNLSVRPMVVQEAQCLLDGWEIAL